MMKSSPSNFPAAKGAGDVAEAAATHAAAAHAVGLEVLGAAFSAGHIALLFRGLVADLVDKFTRGALAEHVGLRHESGEDVGVGEHPAAAKEAALL